MKLDAFEAATQRLSMLEDLLADVADSGVSYQDPRIDYVEVQIDRDTWESVQRFKRRFAGA